MAGLTAGGDLMATRLMRVVEDTMNSAFEGVQEENIRVTGDTVIAVLSNIDKDFALYVMSPYTNPFYTC